MVGQEHPEILPPEKGFFHLQQRLGIIGQQNLDLIGRSQFHNQPPHVLDAIR
jgi:hypothetical protein